MHPKNILIIVFGLALFANAGFFDKVNTKKSKKLTRDEIRKQNEEIAQEDIDNKKMKDTETIIDGQNYDIELVSSKQHATMWKNFMHKFVPEDVYQFIIDGSDSQAYHFTIDTPDIVHIRGFYNTIVPGWSTGRDRETNRINVAVTDPLGQLLFMKRQQDTGIIMVDSTGEGEYTIMFQNLQSSQRLVNFNLHKDYTEVRNPTVQYPDSYRTPNEINEEKNQKRREKQGITEQQTEVPKQEEKVEIDPEEEAISEFDVQTVKQALRQTQSELSHIQYEAKTSFQRQQTHNQDVISNSDYNFYFLVGEIVLCMLFLGFQVKYMQKVLDQKALVL